MVRVIIAVMELVARLGTVLLALTFAACGVPVDTMPDATIDLDAGPDAMACPACPVADDAGGCPPCSNVGTPCGDFHVTLNACYQVCVWHGDQDAGIPETSIVCTRP